MRRSIPFTFIETPYGTDIKYGTGVDIRNGESIETIYDGDRPVAVYHVVPVAVRVRRFWRDLFRVAL